MGSHRDTLVSQRTDGVIQALRNAHPDWELRVINSKRYIRILRILNPENISEKEVTLANHMNNGVKVILDICLETGEVLRGLSYTWPSGRTSSRANLVDDYSYSVLCGDLSP